MQAPKKSSKKKRSHPENDQNMHSFEISNIKFGKLDIVLKSFNSLPTMQSFYENIPEITNCSNDHIFSSEIKNVTETKEEKVIEIPVIAPVSIQPCFLWFNEQCDQQKLVTCWWCRLSVIPMRSSCFIPVYYDETRNKYTKHGYFCSWECTKAFNFEIKDIKTSYRSYLIQRICRKLYGINNTRSIKYAPHWSELNIYGGDLEKDTYLKKFQRTTLESIGVLRENT